MTYKWGEFHPAGLYTKYGDNRSALELLVTLPKGNERMIGILN